MSAITYNPPAPPAIARPRCPCCRVTLRPMYVEVRERVPFAEGGGFATVTVERRWQGRYHGYGAFCTLRCCDRFANLVVTRARAILGDRGLSDGYRAGVLAVTAAPPPEAKP